VAISLERHAADYVLRHLKDKGFSRLRKRQLEHWRECYGQQFAREVEKIVRTELKGAK
jgi:hypothetical protein